MSFDEILESWRERSMVGNIEDRNNLVTSFSTTEKLVQVIEKTVQFSFPPLLATVGALLNLIQNKETLHEVLKQIIFGHNVQLLRRLLMIGYWRMLEGRGRKIGVD
jgi:hypothetical protein